MPYSNHTSNRWLVYITVQTTCKMRLYNDRLRDGSQCKHSVASGSAPLWLVVSGLSWWWLCSVRVWLSVTFSMRSRHSALSIQSMASHWIPSLWRQTPTQTDTPCVYININNQEDTMAALSSVSMWWNEPCPGCWPIVPENNWLWEKVRHFQTSGSLPVWSWRGSTPIPMCVCAVCSFHWC